MAIPDSQLQYVDIITSRVGPDIEQRLDLMAAKYLNVQENIAKYSLFIVDAAHEFRPEKIAFRFYGSKYRWRLICLFNGVVNPLQDLYAGRELRIPDINEVDKFLALIPATRATSGVVDI